MSLGSRAAAAAACLALLSACATAPRPVARPMDAEDYVYPRAQPGELRPDEASGVERAWQDILAGDTPAAEKRLNKLLVETPGLVPAEIALGYARLRAGAFDDASRRFAGVLLRRPDDLSALAGAGAAALRGGRIEEAAAAYARASELDPANEALRRRRSDLRLQVAEKRVATAREAAAAGDADRAVEQYQLVLSGAPELAGVRLELAEVLAGRGDAADALALLEADPTADRHILQKLAELALARGEHERALEAYRKILDADPRDEEAIAAARRIRETMELQQMPEEYRRIVDAETVTRADLAALIMVKVRKLSRVPLGPGRVAVDISGSWAREHIIRALAYEIMTVYPNHTFQPVATVRRGDLARAVARVLDLLQYPSGPAATLSDMNPGNLLYYPAARAVGAGLMDLAADGAFEPWRPVSGREATDVVENLVRLVGN